MRGLLVAVALSALAAAVPGYAATEPIPVAGGCGFVAVRDPGAPGQYTGLLYGDVTAADLPHRDGATTGPATVTLTCSLQATRPHHEEPDAVTVSGSGVNAAVVAPTAFSVPEPGPWEHLSVCGRVDVTDANGTYTYWSNSQNGMWRTDTGGTCDPPGASCTSTDENCSYWVALEKWLTGTSTNELTQWLSGFAEETVCGWFAALAPGVPGVVDVEPEGDVHVAGEWFLDCPPHGT